MTAALTGLSLAVLVALTILLRAIARRARAICRIDAASAVLTREWVDAQVASLKPKAAAAARERGRRDAERDVRSGRLRLRTCGLMLGQSAVCARCMTAVDVLSRAPSACRQCGGRLRPVETTGCHVRARTFAENAAYNERVAEHIQATIHPPLARPDPL